MLRIPNLRLALDGRAQDLKKPAARALGLRESQIRDLRVGKKSVDARDKGDVHFVVSADVALNGDEDLVLARIKPGAAVRTPEYPPLKPERRRRPEHPPVVVGLGPGGLFAALYLARA
ncbi:MAG: hypothetical protein IJ240_00430, partial [Clostridia bacterium]|nr:hypothetical protein [Clostridia bacterium]